VGQNGADGDRQFGYWGAPGGGGFSGNGGNGGNGGALYNAATSGRSALTYDDGNGGFFQASGGGGGGAAGKLRAIVSPGGMCIIPHEHVYQSPRMENNDAANCYY
jgi:hypothetical protein